MSVFIEKKSACQWTCSVQACVIQGSAVFAVPHSWGYDEMTYLRKQRMLYIFICVTYPGTYSKFCSHWPQKQSNSKGRKLKYNVD